MENSDVETKNLLNIKEKNEASQETEQVSLQMFELDLSAVLASEKTDSIKTESSLSDLTFIEDQSLQISSYLRKNESLEFWSAEKVNVVTAFYIRNQDACIKNLFSILMFDWFMLRENSPDCYFLTTKFKFFIDSAEKTYEKLFKKLLDVFDSENYLEYYEFCYNIFYFLFSEIKSTIYDNEKEIVLNFRKIVVPNLIEMVLKMRNKEYQTKILKLVTAFLDNADEEIYINLKEKILESIQHDASPHQSACKISYNEIMKHCDELYFKLLFLLNENLMMSFKFEYKKFKTAYQNYFGEYWTHEIKPNAQLLYIFTDLQQLIDTKEFLLIITEGVNLKSNITSTIKNVAELQAVFVESLDTKHNELLVRILFKQISKN